MVVEPEKKEATMKPRWLLVALTILTMTGPSIGSAADLLDVYERALQSDPTFREAEARLLAAKEQKPLARSLLLPQLDLFYTYQDQNQDGTTAFFDFTTGTNPTNVIIAETTSNSTTRPRISRQLWLSGMMSWPAPGW